VLSVDQLSSFSILEELASAKNTSIKEYIEFMVSESLQLLREVCPPTNQFSKIVHSVKNTDELNHRLRTQRENNRLLISFTYRLLCLTSKCKDKDIHLTIINELPYYFSNNYLHLMVKVIKKRSRICQIIATTADSAVVHVLKETGINIIDMSSCRPA